MHRSGRTLRIRKCLGISRYYSALVQSDPFLAYQSFVNASYFRPDEAQLRAAKELQRLYRRIDGYKPPVDFARKIRKVEKLIRNHESESSIRKLLTASSDKSLVKQLGWEEELLNIDSPQGLLLSGSVGSGKSMLIDTLLPMKKRWHYSAFMLELFARLNRDRDDEYILLKIAHELIEESPILAIDEFQLSDPASARILKGILIYFWKMGGVLVATSNRMPEDLYSGSFQAEQFKSFTELLKTRCIVHDMRSKRDFRKEVTDGLAYYRLSDIQQSPLEAEIVELMGGTGEEHVLTIYNRKLRIPFQRNGIARFDFQYLCESDLGPADYITISSLYHTIILVRVPILTMNKKNEARRFISLIDALYETKCKLLIQAEAEPDALFFPETTTPSGNVDSIASESYSETFYDVTSPNRPNVSSYLNEAVEAARDERHTPMTKQDFAKLNAFTGQDEAFAFRRAASRLHEMTSKHWWTTKTHLPTEVSTRVWENAARNQTGEESARKASEIEFRHGASPFRVHEQPPPKFNWTHFFGMVDRRTDAEIKEARARRRTVKDKSMRS